MTVDEYRKALSELTSEQFQEFRKRWGGTEETVEKCVQTFAYGGERQWEKIIVYHLSRLGVEGLKTEDEIQFLKELIQFFAVIPSLP